MVNAALDQNHVAAIFAADKNDGATVRRIYVNPTDHGILVDDGVTGSDHGPTNDLRDENHRTALMAVSSVDGVTPVVLYADSTGHLLVKST